MKKLKKGLLYCISLILIIMSVEGLTVQAEENEVKDMRVSETEMTEEELQSLKQNAYEMEIQSNKWKNWPQGSATYGEAAIVMEANSGAILYAKNIDGQAYPASITKVLTALIALENGNLEDTITISEECLECLGGGYAHIGLKAGEEISLKDALHAVLLASANEAAEAVASNLCGGYDSFIAEMNNRTKELGGNNSNFVNTNGVHTEEHYTTARDMALITQELLVNHPEFEEISQTLQYTIGPTNLSEESRTFQQKHKMLLEYSKNFDARVIAGKTGYTDMARNTLITCAEDENLKLVVVLLKTYEGAVYEDTENLLNYAFDNFEKIDITKENISSDISEVAQGSYVVVPKGVTIGELKEKMIASDDNETGTIKFTYDGELVGNVKVKLKQDQSGVVLKQEESEQPKEEKSGFSIIKIAVIIFIIIAIVFVLYLMLVIYVRYKRKKARRRRREMQRRKRQQRRRRYY